MVEVEIAKRGPFRVIGTKTWISGTDNEAFGLFWRKAHEEGHVERLRRLCKPIAESLTGSSILGLSCTEDDPSVRSFWFYVAVETDERSGSDGYEVRDVGAYTWAVFRASGGEVADLLECEAFAWREWLPGNGVYEHDNGPEIEAYFSGEKIEYWLPVRKKAAP
jgi:AraC family transcriptional regulator